MPNEQFSPEEQNLYQKAQEATAQRLNAEQGTDTEAFLNAVVTEGKAHEAAQQSIEQAHEETLEENEAREIEQETGKALQNIHAFEEYQKRITAIEHFSSLPHERRIIIVREVESHIEKLRQLLASVGLGSLLGFLLSKVLEKIGSLSANTKRPELN